MVTILVWFSTVAAVNLAYFLRSIIVKVLAVFGVNIGAEVLAKFCVFVHRCGNDIFCVKTTGIGCVVTTAFPVV